MIDEIREYDVVRLYDGREGTVLGIWGEGKAFEVELKPPETATVSKEQIKEIVYRPQ